MPNDIKAGTQFVSTKTKLSQKSHIPAQDDRPRVCRIKCSTQDHSATTTYSTKENRPTCILRINNISSNEINAPIPQGCFRVPLSTGGKTVYSLFDEDPWYVRAAHKLFSLFLKIRNSQRQP